MRNLLCHKVIQKYGLVYKIPMIIIYSKNILKLNTIDDDGRYSTISDMPEAERKDYYIQFKVLIF